MKPSKVTYKKIFPIGSYQNESIGVEMDLDDTDSPDAAFEECKRLVEKWGTPPPEKTFLETLTTPLTGSATTPPIRNLAEEREMIKIETAIDKATKVSDLEFYVEAAEKYGLMDLYNQRLNLLK